VETESGRVNALLKRCKMFLINWWGKCWYGESEWKRRKAGVSGIAEQWKEPYFSHPLDKMAWELRKNRFKTNGHIGNEGKTEETA